MKKQAEKKYIKTIRFNWTYLWLTENDTSQSERGEMQLISIISQCGQM